MNLAKTDTVFLAGGIFDQCLLVSTSSTIDQWGKNSEQKEFNLNFLMPAIYVQSSRTLQALEKMGANDAKDRLNRELDRAIDKGEYKTDLAYKGARLTYALTLSKTMDLFSSDKDKVDFVSDFAKLTLREVHSERFSNSRVIVNYNGQEHVFKKGDGNSPTLRFNFVTDFPKGFRQGQAPRNWFPGTEPPNARRFDVGCPCDCLPGQLWRVPDQKGREPFLTSHNVCKVKLDSES